jgi:hypothetical protein
MEKKDNTKKIIAIFLILVLLQSYFVNLIYIVKATTEIIIGENTTDEVVIGGENENVENQNNIADENLESESLNSEIVVGGDSEVQENSLENVNNSDLSNEQTGSEEPNEV